MGIEPRQNKTQFRGKETWTTKMKRCQRSLLSEKPSGKRWHSIYHPPNTAAGPWAPRKAHPHTFPDSYWMILKWTQDMTHHFIFIHITAPSLSALFPVRVCAHVHVCLWMDILVISVKEKSQKVRLIKENLYTVKFTFMYSSEFDKLWLCTRTVKTTCSSSLQITCSDPVINLHPAPPCCQSPVFFLPF